VTVRLANTDPQAPYYVIGGAPTIRRMVELIYGWIKYDDQLWLKYFAGMELATIKAHMVALLSELLGGPKNYKGRTLAEAHAYLGITTAHYARVRDYVIAALLVVHAPDDIIKTVESILKDAEANIVTVLQTTPRRI
jgi:hemoglobin